LQVHGVETFELQSPGADSERREADVILSCEPGIFIGIVTADCVPILLAAVDGSAVAAIHAGWRGLAAGVIEAGLNVLRKRATKGVALAAAVGPSAGRCCYEVDQPVYEGLARRYDRQLASFLGAGRPGHFQLDLPGLAADILSKNGVEKHRIGLDTCMCTICSGPRFESYRRDGSEAGRLSHFITRPERVERSSTPRVDSRKSAP
jgi:YfiH family protein